MLRSVLALADDGNRSGVERIDFQNASMFDYNFEHMVDLIRLT